MGVVAKVEVAAGRRESVKRGECEEGRGGEGRGAERRRSGRWAVGSFNHANAV